MARTIILPTELPFPVSNEAAVSVGRAVAPALGFTSAGILERPTCSAEIQRSCAGLMSQRLGSPVQLAWPSNDCR